MAEDPIIVTSESKLKRLVSEAVANEMSKFQPVQERKQDEIVPMSVVIKSKRYGGRNTVAKYRDQIMAEGNDPVIFKKQGCRWYMYLDRFQKWFMKQKDIHEEELKIDPRLRG